MIDPTQGIGTILKQIRLERALTLEETSNLTGVSKAMLGQIERGKSNPTISVLWKIATGLKVSFSELLKPQDETHNVIEINNLKPVFESDGKMILHDVFPYDPITGFEYFYISILPGGLHTSTPHMKSTEEHIVVTKGRLRLKVSGQTYDMKAPSAIRFKSNQTHSYENPFDEEVIFQSIVKY
jgi:transcriptional regulator with XRE-family HTH domain